MKPLRKLSDADFALAVKAHIFMVMGHFRGRIKEWDVCNESLAADGSLADTQFLKKMGPGYIAQCFRWAHEADPDAILLYNDNKVEGWGLGSPHSDKADAFFRLLKSLVDANVPIHGCGIQGHFTASGVGVRRLPTPRAVARLVRRVGTLTGAGGKPLTVNLSEFDVRTNGLLVEGRSQSYCDWVQRRIVQDLLAACCAQPNFTGVYLWGVADHVSWVEDFYGEADRPLVLDGEFKEKESYFGLCEAIAGAAADAGTAGVRAGGVHLPAEDYADLDDQSALVGKDPWGADWMLPDPPAPPASDASAATKSS
eukprot:g977.t1